jgi:D-alanyl-D-alanine carboxypeptidase
MVASMYAKSVRQKLPNTQLQALLDDVVKTQHIPGVAMYISTPQGKWRGASGVTSRETNQPLQPDDDFSIASTSKTFVAVVVLQLVHEGRIKLDQTIASYLPQSVGDRVKFSHQITVRQLLNHTSDVAEYLSTPAFIDATQHRDRTRPWTAAEAIQYMFNEPPKASPGTEFSYTDTNYILLELIVQQVTQGTLAQAIRDRILDPLRLKHTYTELREPALGNLVTGYGLNSKSGKMQSFAQINDGNGLGDGSLVSNGEDLSKFIQVLVSGNKLLPEKIKQEMFTFVNDGYGLGLECWTTPFGMAYGHSGSAYGMVSIMLDLPEKHTSVVVLANQQGVDPKDIAIKALASIFPQGS